MVRKSTNVLLSVLLESAVDVLAVADFAGKMRGVRLESCLHRGLELYRGSLKDRVP